MLSITGMYPSPAKLQLWGCRPPGPCLFCPGANTACTQCHIQCNCNATKAARIAAHHGIRRILSSSITATSKGWSSHPESTLETVRTILRELGLVIPELPPFSYRAGEHTAETTVPWTTSAKWRPDDTLIHASRKALCVLEFTRAWDGSVGYDATQDEYKTRRYTAWVLHLRCHLEPKGWTVCQLNFTVGVRGSFQHDKWESLLDKVCYPPKARQQLYQLVHKQALLSLHEVFQAFKTAQISFGSHP